MVLNYKASQTAAASVEAEKKTSPKAKLNRKSSQSFITKGHVKSNSLHKTKTIRRTKSTFLSSSTGLSFKFDKLALSEEDFKFSLKFDGKFDSKFDGTLEKFDVDCEYDVNSPSKRELSSPLQRRPVKNKVRRFRSMFYDPTEIQPISAVGAKIMSNDDTSAFSASDLYLKESKLETFCVKDDCIPRINVGTLIKLLDGEYSHSFNDVKVIDCRFEYEYFGGHIDGSVNINSQTQLESEFLSTLALSEANAKSLMVFHCEFSSYRGPFMALHLRHCDRIINKENYPYLSYPNIVVLEGGYKSFFNLYSSRCIPQQYVEMNDDKHKVVCERELNRFRKDRKKILTKASSFNFGDLSFSDSSCSSISSGCSFSVSAASSASSVSSPSTMSYSTKKILSRHRRHNTMVSNNVFSSFEREGESDSDSDMEFAEIIASKV